MDALAVDPRPAGVEKARGADDLWRLRAGDYRIICTVGDQVLLVPVVRIGRRREAYRA
ncbi:MAG: type II toxin-antitoxin system RelE/ParE family toxin [Gemmatimonadota bacterium]